MSRTTDRLLDGNSDLLIDGRLGPGSGGVFETLNPATEEVLGTATDGTAGDMDRAIGAARRAFDETAWSTDLALRVRCLRQLGEAMRRNGDALRALTIAEVGAPRFLTYGAQLDTPVADLAWFTDLAESYEWSRDLGRAEPMGMPSHRRLLREPVGVVGAITPWNFPHQINLAKLGPALAAGNTVVLKPELMQIFTAMRTLELTHVIDPRRQDVADYKMLVEDMAAALRQVTAALHADGPHEQRPAAISAHDFPAGPASPTTATPTSTGSSPPPDRPPTPRSRTP